MYLGYPLQKKREMNMLPRFNIGGFPYGSNVIKTCE